MYFTHKRISRSFSGCGALINDTIDDIVNGELAVEDLPQITVLQCKEHVFSLNNRRLYVLKKLRSMGLLETVQVRLKAAKKREEEKYTIERCSLTASFLGEGKESEGIGKVKAEHDHKDEQEQEQDQKQEEGQKPEYLNGSFQDLRVSSVDDADEKSSDSARSKMPPRKQQPQQLTKDVFTFAALPSCVKSSYKVMLSLVKRGKNKELNQFLQGFISSGDLTKEQVHSLYNELTDTDI